MDIAPVTRVTATRSLTLADLFTLDPDSDLTVTTTITAGIYVMAPYLILSGTICGAGRFYGHRADYRGLSVTSSIIT